MRPHALKGMVMTINGDPWVVVDVAPAEALAEMVAGILEDEGFVTIVRGADPVDDVFSHLGAMRVGTTVVLVPEDDAGAALALIEETVTDYEGEELEALLDRMEHEGEGAEAAAGEAGDGATTRESGDDED